MQSELGRRIVSAIILGLLVLAATWIGGATFRLVAALIILLVFYEWSAMVASQPRTRPLNMLGWVAAALAALLLVAGESRLALVSIILGCAIVIAWGWLAERSWWIGAGVLYAGLSGIALAGIRGDNGDGLVVLLFVFAVVWATDIAAYFSGRFFGGPKLAPRISPSKTWSGAIGGAFAGVVAGTAVAFLARSETSPLVPLAALVLSIASQMGDLFESWVKRRCGVKDSSHLIPGHGGVMDRVDGLVFAAFAAYLATSAVPYPPIAGSDTAQHRLSASSTPVLSPVIESSPGTRPGTG